MPGTRKKILCIEDDPITAQLVVLELSGRGFEVVVAHDGHEGFVATLESLPDLVLCDIGLPTMSGYEILENLNNLAPSGERIPFIIMTALIGRQSERQARDLGADDYIVKPIDFDRLEATIERLTGQDCAANIASLPGSLDPSMSGSPIPHADRKT